LLDMRYDIDAMNLITRFTGLIRGDGYYRRVPLKQLSGVMGIPESTLRRAALDGRLPGAIKYYGRWHASQAGVEQAMKVRDMRGRE